jgi:[acyl-carrier-protein] S-malonyltransferase
MKPAEERLSVDIDQWRFADLKYPLVTNADATSIRTSGEARKGLKRQVSRPVLWQQSVQHLLGEDVRTFVEVGPGKVLSGLIRSIDKSVTILNAEDEKSLENVVGALHNCRFASANRSMQS